MLTLNVAKFSKLDFWRQHGSGRVRISLLDGSGRVGSKKSPRGADDETDCCEFLSICHSSSTRLCCGLAWTVCGVTKVGNQFATDVVRLLF